MTVVDFPTWTEVRLWTRDAQGNWAFWGTTFYHAPCLPATEAMIQVALVQLRRDAEARVGGSIPAVAGFRDDADAWAGRFFPHDRSVEDTVSVLMDLARHGQEADFRWLARSAGVPEGQLDELWRGTVARLPMAVPTGQGG